MVCQFACARCSRAGTEITRANRSGRMPRRAHDLRRRFSARTDSLTPEQIAARERWQRRWNVPILLAAIVPLLATSPSSKAVQLVVGIGSWIVFVVDLHVQRRIVPDYLRRRNGRIDLGIVVLTFPYYLIPALGGVTAVLMLARLARVVRLLLATAGLRRFMARLGTVAVVAGSMVLVGSLVAYGAEHPTNPGFATVGDSLWWGLVTLTTVGYGDIVPKTAAGRIAGIGIMFTGVATIGILAGSLASLFRLDQPKEEQAAVPRPGAMHEELDALRAQLRDVETRLGDLAEQARTS